MDLFIAYLMIGALVSLWYSPVIDKFLANERPALVALTTAFIILTWPWLVYAGVSDFFYRRKCKGHQ